MEPTDKRIPTVEQWEALKEVIDGAGGVKVLTTDDYNYPANNPTSVALWLLEPGIYTRASNDIVVRFSTGSALASNENTILVTAPTASGAKNYLIINSSTLTARLSHSDSSGGEGTAETVLTGINVSQATGTSTTNAMSQNAVTSMVYADPSSRARVQIGSNANATGVNTLAIGSGAATGGNRASALGAYSVATAIGATAVGYGSIANTQGEVGFGLSSNYAGTGYNNSNYRLLTGLYDPQSDHDAATKGYVDPTTDSSAPTTSTVGRLGQIQIDTSTNTAYMCVSADDVTPTYEWKQITI